VSAILEGVGQACSLIARGDPALLRVVWLSLWCTGLATALAMVAGVPLGVFLALHRFRGRNLFVTFVNAGMGIPPVVVGLFVFLLLARSGPLGGLNLIYTPTAIIAAQVIIALPQVIGVTLAGIQGLDERMALQIVSLGASRPQLYLKLVREGRVAVLAALAAGFGAVISEVGAVMMVGGNIQGQTRVMTTTIVLETRQGNFAMAIALSTVLLVIALVINGVFTWLQQRRAR
jgi:tungstate transport system permease protein